MPRFINMMSVLGFEKVNGDIRKNNKFFVLMEFRKVLRWKDAVAKRREEEVKGTGVFLKPCVYKRR